MSQDAESSQAVATARVPTDRARRYGKQLASHLGRKVQTEWDDATGQGTITFNDPAKVATLVGGDDALAIRLVAPAADLEQLEDVVGRHLVRFGARDELVCIWTRADGSTGTTQRNDG